MAFEKTPSVCVLYADNVKDGYFPKQAHAALMGKADVTFVKVDNFNAQNVATKIFDIQTGDKRPTFIAVDIPNTTKNVSEFASHVHMLGDARSRNVFFGSVKNDAAKKEAFYAEHRMPIVEWKNIRECHCLNGDEIVRQQTKPKAKKENFFLWVLQQFPFSKEAGLRL